MVLRPTRFALAAALSATTPCVGTPAAGASGGFPADAAAEPIRVETLRIDPRAAAPAAGAPGAYAALLSKPPGWVAGGPAVVVLWEEPGRDDLRDRVVAAVLDENAAVLELDAHAARGVAADNASAPAPPAPQELLPDLFAALDALRRDAHAGAGTAAIGYGAAGGAAALLAAREDKATAHLGAHGFRYAGVAALGPGRPAFALGALPAAALDWPPRALRLCVGLSVAVARATAVPADTLTNECAGALAPQRADATAVSALVAQADGR